METLNDYISEYQRQLKKGDIQLAYRGLMEFLSSLRTSMKGKHPDFAISGSIYQGYMDMSYFSMTPQQLKEKDLKIALIFLHEPLRFEIWLTAVNKEIQNKYWYFFLERNWDTYPLTEPGKGVDAIIRHTLVEDPDFNDQRTLMGQIEKGALEFLMEVVPFIHKKS